VKSLTQTPARRRSLRVFAVLGVGAALVAAPAIPGAEGSARLAGVIGPSPAAAQDGPASRFLDRTIDRLNALLRRNLSGAAAERRDGQVHDIIGEVIDFQAIARASLRRHWDDLSAAQRTEFVSLLRQLVERSYRKNLESTLDYAIRYDAERTQGDNKVVETMARNRRNRREPPVTVVYELRPEGDEWRIVDVETDGVGMVANYRSQFNRIIREHGYDELIARMKNRLASEGDETDL